MPLPQMPETELKELIVVEGSMEAEIIKSKLESYQIPVLLKFETVGRIFGITMNGLGKIKIMVPAQLAEKARKILAE